MSLLLKRWFRSDRNSGVIRPKVLELYLTRRCNLACPNCLFRLQKDNFFSGVELAFAKAIRIVDYFFALGIRRIHLQAEGEVLLYEDYWRIVEYCQSLGITVLNLITNGLLVGRYIPEILKYHDGITISVDGYDPETYTQRRGGTAKTFNRVVDNTRRLLEERQRTGSSLRISYNCVIIESNYRIMPGMITLAQELGIDRMQFRNFHRYAPEDLDLRPLYSTPEVLAYIKDLRRREYTVDIKWPEIYGKLKNFHCEMLFDTVTIGSDGFFAPCCHIPSDRKYGSFFLDADGYNTDELVEFRRAMLNAAHRKELPAQCCECPRLQARESKP